MWTPNERATLKSQLQGIQADLAKARTNYPLQQVRDPNNIQKGILADRLDQISNKLAKIIYACDHIEAATEEKL